MCGIAGFVGGKWSGRAQAAAIVARMGRSILHRGPDHSDIWIDEEARLAFAHDRLAILDLSAAGNQPMASHSGRYVIVYNGEIYVLQSPILTDGARMVRTPTYYAFLMYVPFQGASAVPVQVDSPALGGVPALDVTAAKAEGGAVHVALVNANPDETVDVELSLAGIAGRQVSGQVLTAAAMDSRNRFGAAEEVHPVPFRGAHWQGGKLRVAMPAKSIVVLTVK